MYLRWGLAFALACQIVGQQEQSAPPGWPNMPENAIAKLFAGDPTGFVQVLLEDAAAGDVSAMFYLGRAYEEVKGVPHDYSEALKWYEAAAEHGSGPAAWSVGCLYERGRGVQADDSQAQMWFERAASSGYRRAALSRLYVRWYPAPGPLVQTAPPPMFAKFQLTSDDLSLLKKANLTGRLEMQGGGRDGCGISTRIIVIAQTEIHDEVVLAIPTSGTVIYAQHGSQWTKLPEDAQTGEKKVRLAPQDPQHLYYTVEMIELEEGGEVGGSAFVWRRP